MPGPGREEGVAEAASPRGERGLVRADELLQALNRLDALPLVAAGDAGVQLAPRLLGSRARVYALGQDPGDAYEGATLVLDPRDGHLLRLGEGLEEEIDERGVVLEGRRRNEPKLDDVR
jgi:hypothetical protein